MGIKVLSPSSIYRALVSTVTQMIAYIKQKTPLKLKGLSLSDRYNLLIPTGTTWQKRTSKTAWGPPVDGVTGTSCEEGKLHQETFQYFERRFEICLFLLWRHRRFH